MGQASKRSWNMVEYSHDNLDSEPVDTSLYAPSEPNSEPDTALGTIKIIEWKYYMVLKPPYNQILWISLTKQQSCTIDFEEGFDENHLIQVQI